MNSLEEPKIIQALYRASQAGVQIDLIVRGICCLRPGVAGLSDNIRVRSIIDRFLEHSRVFYFENGGDSEVFCGSSDWMPRNFFRRVEVVFPVEDKDLKARLLNEVLLPALQDNVKARLIESDGSHHRPRRTARQKPLRYQQWLIEHITRAPHPDTATGAFLETRLASLAPSTPVVLRPVNLALSPPSADGRAGTNADPILQSLQQSLSIEESDDEEGGERTSVQSTPAQSDDAEKTVKSSARKRRRK